MELTSPGHPVSPTDQGGLRWCDPRAVVDCVHEGSALADGSLETGAIGVGCDLEASCWEGDQLETSHRRLQHDLGVLVCLLCVCRSLGSFLAAKARPSLGLPGRQRN
eukprot:TRINITY_DN4279_c0_g2_i1.p2 TRINITY_DN4279_c0_g2~~TRINITY_DN4279_c0_g2_i1.p2  ORF type:complete len:107 (+),score=1.22 TRINITY_DN4279_c0_g2_i1:123-443(+)